MPGVGCGITIQDPVVRAVEGRSPPRQKLLGQINEDNLGDLYSTKRGRR